jgi:hypothetical protein
MSEGNKVQEVRMASVSLSDLPKAYTQKLHFQHYLKQSKFPPAERFYVYLIG